jgi:hypothetical protein
MQNSSYRNKITFNSTSKIHRIYFMKLFAANRETFGPNEKFHEMGEPHVGHLKTFVSHCMYTVCTVKEMNKS